MSRRVVPTPLKPGFRTPEEFRETVRKVVAERDAATWRKVKEWESDSEELLAETDPSSEAQQIAPPLTGAQPSAKLRPMKKRVLLEPAVRSPKRALIRAAVEKVVAEEKRREAEERAAARKARTVRRSEPAQESTSKKPRKILDPIRPGRLRIEDIRAAVRAVAAEEAGCGEHQGPAGARRGPSSAERGPSKCLS